MMELADVTPDWLTQRLDHLHPETAVTGVDIVDVRSGTNSVVRLELTYAKPSALPRQMFLKLPPLNPKRRAAVNRTGMGRREAFFYQRLAPHVPMRVPRPYIAEYDEADGSFVLLIEDLPASGCTFPDPVAGVSLEFAIGAMDRYAALHVRYEDPETRHREASWVEPSKRGSDYGRNMLQSGLDNHRDRLRDEFAAIAQIYIDQQDALHDLWTAGPTTVIQGDGHIGNLFEDHGEPGWADWGLVNLGSPMRDVSYFLIMALRPELRAAHERELLDRYLHHRSVLGGAAISSDDAWTQHRLQSAYAVPASCQIVLFPDAISDERRRFSEAFLARADAAVEELDARGALADVGIRSTGM